MVSKTTSAQYMFVAPPALREYLLYCRGLPPVSEQHLGFRWRRGPPSYNGVSRYCPETRQPEWLAVSYPWSNSAPSIVHKSVCRDRYSMGVSGGLFCFVLEPWG